jgi:hypothetical protein
VIHRPKPNFVQGHPLLSPLSSQDMALHRFIEGDRNSIINFIAIICLDNPSPMGSWRRSQCVWAVGWVGSTRMIKVPFLGKWTSILVCATNFSLLCSTVGWQTLERNPRNQHRRGTLFSCLFVLFLFVIVQRLVTSPFPSTKIQPLPFLRNQRGL